METVSPIIQSIRRSVSEVCDWSPKHQGHVTVIICEDHQLPAATASAKFEHTVITNELAHGLKFLSASRYLQYVICAGTVGRAPGVFDAKDGERWAGRVVLFREM